MYKSPIEEFLTDMRVEHENGVLRAVQNVGFYVDKYELTKALAYDRGQYDKGYEDGVNRVLGLIREKYHNFCGLDLEKMTKYGNETVEQQNQSYSTVMMYEVADAFEDILDRIEEKI